MKIVVSGRNITISEAVKDQVDKKLKKLDKMFKSETEAFVTFSTQRHLHLVEITIPIKNGAYLRAVGSQEDMYKAIDDASDKIIRQMRKHKTKLERRFHSHNSFDFDEIPEHDEAESDIRIVRSKKFALKPMHPEEAVLQMDLIHHDFYVFINGETDEVNVVYRRNDGDFGLIEPTV